jgi:hypothetical protein
MYIHGGDFSTTESDIFGTSRVMLFYPPHIAARIIVQRGCFTVHPDPATACEWPGTLYLLRILCSRRREIRRQLFGLGVTYSALFPDLDGLAKGTNDLLRADDDFVP